MVALAGTASFRTPATKAHGTSSLILHPIAAGAVLRASMSQHQGPQGYPAYGQPPYYNSNQQTQLPSAQQPFLPHPAHSAGAPAQQAYGQPGPGGFPPQRPQQARLPRAVLFPSIALSGASSSSFRACGNPLPWWLTAYRFGSLF